MGLRQEMERADERIETVDYRIVERVAEIDESFDTFDARVRNLCLVVFLYVFFCVLLCSLVLSCVLLCSLVYLLNRPFGEFFKLGFDGKIDWTYHSTLFFLRFQKLKICTINKVSPLTTTGNKIPKPKLS